MGVGMARTGPIDIEIQSIEKHDSFQNDDDFHEEIINFDKWF